MFFMTSSFTDGGGSLKASKPGNAFSDLLGVVCLSHSLILENLVGLKSSCNKEPVIFSWGGSQGFWKEDGFQWGTEWGSVVANRV